MQSYVVIEIQTSAEGRTATLVSVYDDIGEAYHKYHTILAAAAISALPVHGAAILDTGNTIGLMLQEYVFRRDVPPEPEEAPEAEEGAPEDAPEEAGEA